MVVKLVKNAETEQTFIHCQPALHTVTINSAQL